MPVFHELWRTAPSGKVVSA